MKKIIYSIIALYVALTIHPISIAIGQQDYAQFGLPNGAVVRLGKGFPTGPFNIAFSPDGNILALPSMIGV